MKLVLSPPSDAVERDVHPVTGCPKADGGIPVCAESAETHLPPRYKCHRTRGCFDRILSRRGATLPDVSTPRDRSHAFSRRRVETGRVEILLNKGPRDELLLERNSSGVVNCITERFTFDGLENLELNIVGAGAVYELTLFLSSHFSSRGRGFQNIQFIMN